MRFHGGYLVKFNDRDAQLYVFTRILDLIPSLEIFDFKLEFSILNILFNEPNAQFFSDP